MIEPEIKIAQTTKFSIFRLVREEIPLESLADIPSIAREGLLSDNLERKCDVCFYLQKIWELNKQETGGLKIGLTGKLNFLPDSPSRPIFSAKCSEIDVSELRYRWGKKG